MHGSNSQCFGTNFVVARKDGNRVRFQCLDCLTMFPWEKGPDQPLDTSGSILDRLAKMTAIQLRPIALINGITGASKMRKQDLLSRFKEIHQQRGLVT